MKISTKGRYALRMLVDVAQHQSSGTVTLKEIAERQGISKKYLEQIALVLSQAGILRGARGHQGGYRLAIAPEKLSVAEIIRVMEGSLAPVACLDRHPNECERCNECQTLFVWEGLDRVIQSYLEGIPLQDVLAHPLPSVRTTWEAISSPIAPGTNAVLPGISLRRSLSSAIGWTGGCIGSSE